MASHEHANFIAQNYDLYEEYMKLPVSSHSLIIAKDIFDRSFGTLSNPIEDAEVLELNSSIRRGTTASHYKVQEYSSVVVRNATEGFDIYLVDEDGVFVDATASVAADKVAEAFNVLALRATLFSNGYVVQDAVVARGFYEASSLYDDEYLLKVVHEIEKILASNPNTPIYDIVRVVGQVLSTGEFTRVIYANVVKEHGSVVDALIAMF